MGLEMVPNEVENRDPVIIFGDALIANQAFSSSGWGDIEENVNVPANYSYGNHGDPWEQIWGNSYGNEPIFERPCYTIDGWCLRNGSDSRHMEKQLKECLRTPSSLVSGQFSTASGASLYRFGIKKLLMAKSSDCKMTTYNLMSSK